MLWRARWQHWVWDTFGFTSPFADWGQDHQAANENLKLRVLDVSSGTDNPQELVAAFHAVMRSLGANLVQRTDATNANYNLYTSGGLYNKGQHLNSNDFHHNIEKDTIFVLSANYFKPSLLNYVTFCLSFCNRSYFISLSNIISKHMSYDGAIIQIKNLEIMISHTYPLGPVDFFDFANQFITFSDEAPKCPRVPSNG